MAGGLGRLIGQTRGPEDFGGEEYRGVNAGELLGQHHHDGDDERLAEGRVEEHLLEGDLRDQLHGLLLLLHLVHLVVNLDGGPKPGQSCNGTISVISVIISMTYTDRYLDLQSLFPFSLIYPVLF